MAEAIGDLIGAHDINLANRAYELSGELREWSVRSE